MAFMLELAFNMCRGKPSKKTEVTGKTIHGNN